MYGRIDISQLFLFCSPRIQCHYHDECQTLERYELKCQDFHNAHWTSWILVPNWIQDVNEQNCRYPGYRVTNLRSSCTNRRYCQYRLVSPRYSCWKNPDDPEVVDAVDFVSDRFFIAPEGTVCLAMSLGKDEDLISFTVGKMDEVDHLRCWCTLVCEINCDFKNSTMQYIRLPERS